MTREEAAIYRDLEGRLCVCGAAKTRGESFCKKDYFSLPWYLRRRLYDRAGYCATFLEACKILKLDPPKPIAEMQPGLL